MSKSSDNNESDLTKIMKFAWNKQNTEVRKGLFINIIKNYGKKQVWEEALKYSLDLFSYINNNFNNDSRTNKDSKKVVQIETPLTFQTQAPIAAKVALSSLSQLNITSNLPCNIDHITNLTNLTSLKTLHVSKIGPWLTSFTKLSDFAVFYGGFSGSRHEKNLEKYYYN